MKRYFSLIIFVLLSFSLAAGERETIWPKGKMPHRQDHQIAAMTDEAGRPGFNADKHRTAYLEWYEAPAADKRNGGCMILISGGSYECCCDIGLIKQWNERFTELGFQCVNFVYRTPRPVGLPIYQTAWEDGQRAVRMVRSQAAERGFDPEKIGVISMSAGSHLGLLLATSSQTPSYERVDKLDDIPCHINWAIVNAPAYGTTDAENGTPALRQGYGADVKLSEVFRFDEKTCPMSLHHGGTDVYAPHTSILVYKQLRRMGIPAELHLYADKGHGAFGLERGVEFMRQMGYMGEVQEEERLMDRYTCDDARGFYAKENIWPEGKTPDLQQEQCVPYIEWHIPANLTTKAIQIVYSGGAYYGNNPDDFEVAPIRRYLNEKGMAVVTLKYRTPRPAGNLAKHTTAWQDLQRTIKIVRSQALAKGLDPDRIGIMGSSAGGHLTLMGVTSSRHQSYWPIDEIDRISCKVQWGVGIYPAYVLSDGFDGENSEGGNSDGHFIAPEFSFDLDTAPMVFIHGDADGYSAMGSVKVWEKMAMMGIQSDLHTLATRYHCFHRQASPGTGSYTHLNRIWEFLTSKGFNQ
jgi:acetyl esterase/lipase